MDTDNEPTQPDQSEFNVLDALADTGELTESKLNDVLNSYAEAYRQEFETNTKKAPENVEEYTRDFFKKNVHAAAAQIVWLAHNSTSDSVRASMSKYIVQAALEQGQADGDPIKDLLKSLTKNDPAPAK